MHMMFSYHQTYGIKIDKDSHKKIIRITWSCWKSSLVFTFVNMPRWHRSICLILYLWFWNLCGLDSEAKETQIQTGEKLVEKVPLEYDKHWCSKYWFSQSLTSHSTSIIILIAYRFRCTFMSSTFMAVC